MRKLIALLLALLLVCSLFAACTKQKTEQDDLEYETNYKDWSIVV